MQLRQGISDVIQKVKDFDKAMTDIQMVTGKSDSSVKQLLADYSELAKELGTTTEAVAEGEFVRPLKILWIAGNSLEPIIPNYYSNIIMA